MKNKVITPLSKKINKKFIYVTMTLLFLSLLLIMSLVFIFMFKEEKKDHFFFQLGNSDSVKAYNYQKAYSFYKNNKLFDKMWSNSLNMFNRLDRVQFCKAYITWDEGINFIYTYRFYLVKEKDETFTLFTPSKERINTYSNMKQVIKDIVLMTSKDWTSFKEKNPSDILKWNPACYQKTGQQTTKPTQGSLEPEKEN